MKKNVLAVVLVFAVIIGLRAQGPPPQQQMKLEDVQKALSLVDKPQPAPDKFKAGLGGHHRQGHPGDADLHFVRPHGRP